MSENQKAEDCGHPLVNVPVAEKLEEIARASFEMREDTDAEHIVLAALSLYGHYYAGKNNICCYQAIGYIGDCLKFGIRHVYSTSKKKTEILPLAKMTDKDWILLLDQGENFACALFGKELVRDEEYESDEIYRECLIRTLREVSDMKALKTVLLLRERYNIMDQDMTRK